MEIKLNFLLNQVKFGKHQIYQDWFQKKVSLFIYYVYGIPKTSPRFLLSYDTTCTCKSVVLYRNSHAVKQLAQTEAWPFFMWAAHIKDPPITYTYNTQSHTSTPYTSAKQFIYTYNDTHSEGFSVPTN